MTDNKTPPRHLRERQRLEQNLNDINQKLNHIIFRLREDDPRTREATKRLIAVCKEERSGPEDSCESERQ